MSKKSSGLLLITGPTGVGKTAFALELAQTCPQFLGTRAEIISIDAYQIYQGLAKLTDQPSYEAQKKIRHHLIGVLPLKVSSDPIYYRSQALPIIDALLAEGKTPIVVGGSGFYLKTLLYDLDPLPAANLTLRESFTSESLSSLLNRIEQLDNEAPSMIATQNRRRVERVLELLILTGKPLRQLWQQNPKPHYDYRGVFLYRNREEQRQLIQKRAATLIEPDLLKEIAALEETSLSRTAAQTLGLKELQAYIRGDAAQEETITKIAQKTSRYAKRQETWFRHQLSLPQLCLSDYSTLNEAILPAWKKILF